MPNKQGLKPNILLIMSDQHRADCLGGAGHPQVRTPVLDRIASEGVRLKNTFTVCPVCMPARASFLNGRYPHNHHMWHNRGRMPAEQETFFHHLQEADYHTGYIGKAHLYPNTMGHVRDEEPYMRSRGLTYVHEVPGPFMSVISQQSYYSEMLQSRGVWEVFKEDYLKRKRLPNRMIYAAASPLPTELSVDTYIANKAIEYISQLHDGPHCLMVSFGGPHEPWDPPDEYAGLYRPEESPWPTAFEETPGSVLVEAVLNMRAHYYGKITLIDNLIGQIFGAYKDRGMLDDLLILYLSDHGEMAGDHGRYGKDVFYEASIRVPFILRWSSRFKEGLVSDALVESVDVFATILDVVGARASLNSQGRSLLPLLMGRTTEHRDSVLSEIAARPSSEARKKTKRLFMIRTKTHKYAVNDAGKGYMLFDLNRDADELVNLCGRPDASDIELEMRDRLLRRLLESQMGVAKQVGPLLGPII